MDGLFNHLQAGDPRLLFKGGTSLSKAFGLISRFSEDIDITVFREDIGETASVETLEALSGKKRQAKLDAIKQACQGYIGGAFMEQLSTYFRDTLERAQISLPPKVELDLDDTSRQSLLLWYPSVLAATDGYAPWLSKLRWHNERQVTGTKPLQVQLANHIIPSRILNVILGRG